ncbi:hypothetical protein LWI28_028909 [Acer negundo]|uniref:Uncharacterized protein n=1 Tax=Acer negundo TaxID=4023 RepID=A0AAD5NK30_ACENE|nr:hypothetical protein LWI28_028909 [Acer negundo]
MPSTAQPNTVPGPSPLGARAMLYHSFEARVQAWPSSCPGVLIVGPLNDIAGTTWEEKVLKRHLNGTLAILIGGVMFLVHSSLISVPAAPKNKSFALKPPFKFVI